MCMCADKLITGYPNLLGWFEVAFGLNTLPVFTMLLISPSWTLEFEILVIV